MSENSGTKSELSVSGENSLLRRVATILDQARNNVVRSVNTNMVVAYWLIVREIVQELQGETNERNTGNTWLRDSRRI